ncbi:MAG: hypothetical protein MUE65_01425 [Methanomassiliicoccales archaeon]|nr:hypothetical protein [Methanomassiliicoccales archaeon]
MTVLSTLGKDRRYQRKKMLDALASRGECTLTDAQTVNSLAGGLRKGKVIVDGDVADYFGILNAGAELIVNGSAGRFAGDCMTSGVITISGDAGEGLGDYCYGGTCHVKGSVGNFIGTMNKGGTIVVEGDAGHDAGTYMTSGEIVILGSAGPNLGNYIISGSIYVLGGFEDLGENATEERMVTSDFDRLSAVLNGLGVEAEIKSFRKIVPLSAKPFYKEKPKRAEVRP